MLRRTLSILLSFSLLATAPGTTAWANLELGLPQSGSTPNSNANAPSAYAPSVNAPSVIAPANLGLPSNVSPLSQVSDSMPSLNFNPLFTTPPTGGSLDTAAALAGFGERMTGLMQGPPAGSSAGTQRNYYDALGASLDKNVQSGVRQYQDGWQPSGWKIKDPVTGVEKEVDASTFMSMQSDEIMGNIFRGVLNQYDHGSSVDFADLVKEFGQANPNDKYIDVNKNQAAADAKQDEYYKKLSDYLGKDGPNATLKHLQELYDKLTADAQKLIHNTNKFLASLGAQMQYWQKKLDGKDGIQGKIDQLVNNSTKGQLGWKQVTQNLENLNQQITKDESLLKVTPSEGYGKLNYKIEQEKIERENLKKRQTEVDGSLCGPGHKYSASGDCTGTPEPTSLIGTRDDIKFRIDLFNQDISTIKDTYKSPAGKSYSSDPKLAGELGRTWDPNNKNVLTTIADAQSKMLAAMESDQSAQQATSSVSGQKAKTGATGSQLKLSNNVDQIDKINKDVSSKLKPSSKTLNVPPALLNFNADAIKKDDKNHEQIKVNPVIYSAEVLKVRQDLIDFNNKQMKPYTVKGSGSELNYLDDHMQARAKVGELKGQLQGQIDKTNKISDRIKQIQSESINGELSDDQKAELRSLIADLRCASSGGCSDMQNQVLLVGTPFVERAGVLLDPVDQIKMLSPGGAAVGVRNKDYIPDVALLNYAKAISLESGFGTLQNFDDAMAFNSSYASTPNGYVPRLINVGYDRSNPQFVRAPALDASGGGGMQWSPQLDENGNAVWIDKDHMMMGWNPISTGYKNFFPMKLQAELAPFYADLRSDSITLQQENISAYKAGTLLQNDSAYLGTITPGWSPAVSNLSEVKYASIAYPSDGGTAGQLMPTSVGGVTFAPALGIHGEITPMIVNGATGAFGAIVDAGKYVLDPIFGVAKGGWHLINYELGGEMMHGVGSAMYAAGDWMMENLPVRAGPWGAVPSWLKKEGFSTQQDANEIKLTYAESLFKNPTMQWIMNKTSNLFGTGGYQDDPDKAVLEFTGLSHAVREANGQWTAIAENGVRQTLSADWQMTLEKWRAPMNTMPTNDPAAPIYSVLANVGTTETYFKRGIEISEGSTFHNAVANLASIGDTYMPTAIGMYGVGVLFGGVGWLATSPEVGTAVNVGAKVVQTLNQWVVGPSMAYGFTKDTFNNIDIMANPKSSSAEVQVAFGKIVGTVFGMGSGGALTEAYGIRPVDIYAKEGARAAEPNTSASLLLPAVGRSLISLTTQTAFMMGGDLLGGLGGSVIADLGGKVGFTTAYAGEHYLQQNYQEKASQSIALQRLSGIDPKSIVVEPPHMLAMLAGAHEMGKDAIEQLGGNDRFVNETLNQMTQKSKGDRGLLNQIVNGESGETVALGNGGSVKISEGLQQVISGRMFSVMKDQLNADQLSTLVSKGDVEVNGFTLRGSQLNPDLVAATAFAVGGKGAPFLVGTDMPTVASMQLKIGDVLIDSNGTRYEVTKQGFKTIGKEGPVILNGIEKIAANTAVIRRVTDGRTEILGTVTQNPAGHSVGEPPALILPAVAHAAAEALRSIGVEASMKPDPSRSPRPSEASGSAKPSGLGVFGQRVTDLLRTDSTSGSGLSMPFAQPLRTVVISGLALIGISVSGVTSTPAINGLESSGKTGAAMSDTVHPSERTSQNEPLDVKDRDNKSPSEVRSNTHDPVTSEHPADLPNTVDVVSRAIQTNLLPGRETAGDLRPEEPGLGRESRPAGELDDRPGELPTEAIKLDIKEPAMEAAVDAAVESLGPVGRVGELIGERVAELASPMSEMLNPSRTISVEVEIPRQLREFVEGVRRDGTVTVEGVRTPEEAIHKLADNNPEFERRVRDSSGKLRVNLGVNDELAADLRVRGEQVPNGARVQILPKINGAHEGQGPRVALDKENTAGKDFETGREKNRGEVRPDNEVRPGNPNEKVVTRPKGNDLPSEPAAENLAQEARESLAKQAADFIGKKLTQIQNITASAAQALSVKSLLSGLSIKLGTGQGKTLIGALYAAAKENAQVYLIQPDRSLVNQMFDEKDGAPGGGSYKTLIEKLSGGRKTVYNLDDLYEKYNNGTDRESLIKALLNPNGVFVVQRSTANFIQLKAVRDTVLARAWFGDHLPQGVTRVALMDEFHTLSSHESVVEANGSGDTLGSTAEGLLIWRRAEKMYNALNDPNLVTSVDSRPAFDLAKAADSAESPQYVRYYDPIADRTYLTDSARDRVLLEAKIKNNDESRGQLISVANALGQWEVRQTDNPILRGAVVEETTVNDHGVLKQKIRVISIDEATSKRQPDRTLSDSYLAAGFALAAGYGPDTAPTSETLMQVTEAQAQSRYTEIVGMTATPEGVEALLRNKIGAEVVDIDATNPSAPKPYALRDTPYTANEIIAKAIQALRGEGEYSPEMLRQKGLTIDKLSRVLVSGLNTKTINVIEAALREAGFRVVKADAANLEKLGTDITGWKRPGEQPQVILLTGKSGTLGTNWQGDFLQLGDITWVTKSAFDQLIGRSGRIIQGGNGVFGAVREFWTNPEQLNNIVQRISTSQAEALIEQWNQLPKGAKASDFNVEILRAQFEQGQPLSSPQLRILTADLLQRAQNGETLNFREMEAVKQNYLQAVAESKALVSEVTEGYQRVMTLQPLQEISAEDLSKGDRKLLQAAIQKVTGGGNRFASNLPEDMYTNADDYVVRLFNQHKTQAIEILSDLRDSIENSKARETLSKAVDELNKADAQSVEAPSKPLKSRDVTTPEQALQYAKQVAKSMVPIESSTDPVTARVMTMVNQAAADVIVDASPALGAAPVDSRNPLSADSGGSDKAPTSPSGNPLSKPVNYSAIRQAALEAMHANPSAAQSMPIIGILANAPVNLIPEIVQQYAFNQVMGLAGTYATGSNPAMAALVQKLAPVIEKLAPTATISAEQRVHMDRLEQKGVVNLPKLNVNANLNLSDNSNMATPGRITSAAKFVGNTVQTFRGNAKKSGFKTAMGGLALSLRSMSASSSIKTRGIIATLVGDPTMAPMAARLLNRNASSNPALVDQLNNAAIQQYADMAVSKLPKRGISKDAVEQRRNEVVTILNNARQIAVTAFPKYKSHAGFETRRAKDANGDFAAVATFDPRSSSHFDEATTLMDHSRASGGTTAVYLNPTAESRRDARQMNALGAAVRQANDQGASVYLVGENGVGLKLTSKGVAQARRMPVIHVKLRTQAAEAIKNIFKKPEAPFNVQKLADLHQQLDTITQQFSRPGQAGKNMDIQKIVQQMRQVQDEIQQLSSRIRALAPSFARAYALTHASSTAVRKGAVQTLLNALAAANTDEDMMKAIQEFTNPRLSSGQTRSIAKEAGISVDARTNLTKTPLHAVQVNVPPMTALEAMAQALSDKKLKGARIHKIHWDVVFGKFIDQVTKSQAYIGKTNAQQIDQLKKDFEAYLRKLPPAAQAQARAVFNEKLASTFSKTGVISSSVQNAHIQGIRSRLLSQAPAGKQAVWVVPDQAAMDRLNSTVGQSAALPGAGQPVVTEAAYKQYQEKLQQARAKSGAGNVKNLPASWASGLSAPVKKSTPILTSGRIWLASGSMVVVAGVAAVVGAPVALSAGALIAGLGMISSLLLYKGGLEDALQVVKISEAQEDIPAVAVPAPVPVSAKTAELNAMLPPVPYNNVLEMPAPSASPSFARRHAGWMSRAAAIVGALILVNDANAGGMGQTWDAVQSIDPVQFFTYAAGLGSAFFFRQQIVSGAKAVRNQAVIWTNA